MNIDFNFSYYASGGSVSPAVYSVLVSFERTDNLTSKKEQLYANLKEENGNSPRVKLSVCSVLLCSCLYFCFDLRSLYFYWVVFNSTYSIIIFSNS